ncbi:MAG: transposase, partial [Myxococcales bacterium]
MGQRECRQQVYDHRLRELVRHTGDVGIAVELGVPRSTVAGWLCSDPQPVVSLDVLEMTDVTLQAEVVELRRRVQTLNGVLGLLLAVLRVAGFRLDRVYISDPAARNDLLRAVERARKNLSASAILRVLRISASRYNLWVRAERGCSIDDRTMCPRSSPNKLTPDEVVVIEQMVTAERYRHVPTGRLAVLAQRLGKVFASPSTWYRLVRDQGWRRPRRRLHPNSPKVGVRASKPDEIWHIDASCVRLVDGTKVWLHAVIDNFSRKILAWCVAERFDISNAAAVLQAAVCNAVGGDPQPQLMADGGIENFNAEVDDLVGRGLLSRVRALVEVRFSNSMIESWWNNLKHQWLFLHRLETVAAVRRHVTFYVAEYNATIPHAAFSGQTPDEVYFGRGAEIPAQLEAAKRAAQARRLAANRAMSCEIC